MISIFIKATASIQIEMDTRYYIFGGMMIQCRILFRTSLTEVHSMDLHNEYLHSDDKKYPYL